MSYDDQYSEVATALELSGGPQYRWLGEASAFAPPQAWASLTEEQRTSIIASGVRDLLYGSFYVRGGARRGAFVAPDRVAERAEIAALAAVNGSHGYWDSGWRVDEQIGDEVVVEKEGLRARTSTGLCVPTPARGLEVAVRYPPEYQRLLPGFFLITGDHGVPTAPLVRVYWNAAECATDLVRVLTHDLTALGVAFRLKLALGTAAAHRADAGVLYLSRSDYGRAAATLAAAARALERGLGEGVPAMTKRLRRGVGLAEDPGPQQSFGQHRCALLAQALIAGRDRDASGRVDAIVAALADAGLDPRRPYLQPESRDNYEFPA